MSQLKLIKSVPFHKDYINTIKFSSAIEQKTYFDSKAVKSIAEGNSGYIRTNKQIKVTGNVDDYQDINYLMFSNKNKWFYCFVDSVSYLSENAFVIDFTIDVMQTYQFDWTLKTSFVEREHVTDDTIGLHLVPENLDVGQVKIQSYEPYIEGRAMVIVCAVNRDYNPPTYPFYQGANYGGIFSGLKYYGFSKTDIVSLKQFLQDYQDAGFGDAIHDIFLVPESTLSGSSWVSGEEIPSNFVSVDYKSITPIPSIDGYTPKNNKLLTHPYRFLEVDNGENQAQYRYERFTNGVNFEIRGTSTSNPQLQCVPLDYKGLQKNLQEALTIAGYPKCAWVTDVYANWIAQQGLTTGIGLASSLLTAGVGIATLNPVIAGGGILGALSTFGSFYEKSLLPDTTNGTDSSNVLVAHSEKTFKFYQKTITYEYAVMIDEFLEKFGYKINRLKTPNITSRPHWNYIKTQDVNITGEIPNNAMMTIKENFNKGITFWHDSDVGNYNRSNK